MQITQEWLERGGLERLSAFVAVADTGSFTKASGQLGRDASVLSRRVTELEKQLGVRLLARTTRRVVLTEIGEVYLNRVRSALDELASASRAASDVADSPQGLLRVSRACLVRSPVDRAAPAGLAAREGRQTPYHSPRRSSCCR